MKFIAGHLRRAATGRIAARVHHTLDGCCESSEASSKSWNFCFGDNTLQTQCFDTNSGEQQWQNIRTKKQQSITKTPPSLIVRRRNSTERVTTKTAGSTPVKLTATRTGPTMLRKKRTTNRKVRDKQQE